MTHDGHQIAMTASLDAEHAKAILGVVKRNPLNQAGEYFLWRMGWG